MNKLCFKDKNDNDILIFTEESIEIIDPKEAAIALFDHTFNKISKKQWAKHSLYGGGVKSLLSIDLEKVKLELEFGVKVPANWNDLVAHFNRIAKQKAFL